MDAEKIRNLTDPELEHQQRELNDQLFRLKFQLRMGQTESLKKLRGLRKDVARVKTIIRQRELGITGPVAAGTEEEVNGRDYSYITKEPPQHQDWAGGFHQDAEDHRGRGDHA
jgi:large subunit ribosomal protein L29